MTTIAQSFESPIADTLRPSVRRDLFVVFAVAVATFALASLLELNERVLAVTRPLEPYQIDELPITFLAMIVALAWFSWRRSRQMLEQANLRIQAQQALIQREQQYRLLFMENLSGNVLMDPSGRILLSNPAAARLFNVEGPEALQGRSIGEFYADAGEWRAHRARLLEGDKIELPTLQLRRQDGSDLRVVATLCRAPYVGGDSELHLYMTDITELTRVQHDLAEALRENRLLSQRYLQAQEDERRELARELHDELGQSLNAIKVDAVAIRDQSEALPDIRRGAQAIIDLSSHVYDTVRSLTRQLRPVALDELGLVPAVQYAVDQWQRRHAGVRCEFRAEGELQGLDERVNITVYRLIQECLTNVAKHAQAARVRIAIGRAAGRDVLSVSFSDDGRGFEPGSRGQGLGLIGLRERVEALGGRFELDAAPGKGVRIDVTIPVGARR
ncbi:MAG TPA: histidine kinase [Burkholderiales bacterium]|jgi:PAS domain S-box-containing protein|nr:histidine kinase [Burkholderiales bacterium]